MILHGRLTVSGTAQKQKEPVSYSRLPRRVTKVLIQCTESESGSVVSNSLQPHGLYSPWNSPGQNTGVGSLSLFQGIFPTQGSNPGLLHCRQTLYQLSHKGSPSLNLESMLIHGDFTARSLSILAMTFFQINSLSQIQGGHIVACRGAAYSTYSKRR